MICPVNYMKLNANISIIELAHKVVHLLSMEIIPLLRCKTKRIDQWHIVTESYTEMKLGIRFRDFI